MSKGFDLQHFSITLTVQYLVRLQLILPPQITKDTYAVLAFCKNRNYFSFTL